MFQRIIDAVCLPDQITEFERRYLERMNKIGFCFFAAHLPVFVLLAYSNGTGPLLALLLTAAVLVGPALAFLAFDNPRHVSLTHGFTAMLMGGILVHVGQGPVQIEMHFYFFALLAMLAIYGNPLVILVAAVTVALHHLAGWWLVPSSVFNYDAPIWVVLVHAAFVVLESVATCYIARNFFDNVIGLERIVQAAGQRERPDVPGDLALAVGFVQAEACEGLRDPGAGVFAQQQGGAAPRAIVQRRRRVAQREVPGRVGEVHAASIPVRAPGCVNYCAWIEGCRFGCCGSRRHWAPCGPCRSRWRA